MASEPRRVEDRDGRVGLTPWPELTRHTVARPIGDMRKILHTMGIHFMDRHAWVANEGARDFVASNVGNYLNDLMGALADYEAVGTSAVTYEDLRQKVYADMGRTIVDGVVWYDATEEMEVELTGFLRMLVDCTHDSWAETWLTEGVKPPGSV